MTGLDSSTPSPAQKRTNGNRCEQFPNSHMQNLNLILHEWHILSICYSAYFWQPVGRFIDTLCDLFTAKFVPIF